MRSAPSVAAQAASPPTPHPTIKTTARFTILSAAPSRLVPRWARASKLSLPNSLSRRHSFYFLVALHEDISKTIWSIVVVIVWERLFPSWVYSDEKEPMPRQVYENGGNLLQVTEEPTGGAGRNHRRCRTRR